MLMRKNMLHRDVSMGNIFRGSEHRGVKVDYEGKPGTIPYCPINAILQDGILDGIKNDRLRVTCIPNSVALTRVLQR